MPDFKLHSNFDPTGDQPQAIESLVDKVERGEPYQTLLGVTGSGKTFTMANVIEQTQKPTLIIAHNKTLAAQLYQEFRDFFPENAVSYFVSYYDYYQPEAYVPSTDTYIEKEATINDEIDKLRLAATTNLLTRRDVIVVASVSCIYNLGSPVEYGQYQLRITEGQVIQRQTLLLRMAQLQYERSDAELERGTYRLRGDSIQLWPAYEDVALRIDTLENRITTIDWIDPISGSVLRPEDLPHDLTGTFDESGGSAADDDVRSGRRVTVYPAKHYTINPKSQKQAFKEIRDDLQKQIQKFKSENKLVEAYRIEQKVNYDLEMLQEFGFVNGIENYSRYFDGRDEGAAPYTLLDYMRENAKRFKDERDGEVAGAADDFLTIIDESHMTLPQIGGMYNGDRARKETLIDYGFRLPSALDNRPLKKDEFMDKTDLVSFVSATPKDTEIELSGGEDELVEQLIRPTGLVDPEVELRSSQGQIEDLIIEILKRKQSGQRSLVTTLTKKMSEALTSYLNDTKKINELVERFLEQERQEQAAREADPDAPEHTIPANEQLPVEEMELGPIDSYYHTRASLDPSTPSQTRLDTDNIQYPQVAYLHSDIDTMERSDILDDLRRGEYDVVIGINLLREGLDLPEVSLVAILDADKAGFLRSETALVQTMGRAARHVEGHAILYGDQLTKAMRAAISETERRRNIQLEYNREHGITPRGIQKPIRERMIEITDHKSRKPWQQKRKGSGRNRGPSEHKQSSRAAAAAEAEQSGSRVVRVSKKETIDLDAIEPDALLPEDRNQIEKKLRRAMRNAAGELDYELAAEIRDVIEEL